MRANQVSHWIIALVAFAILPAGAEWQSVGPGIALQTLRWQGATVIAIRATMAQCDVRVVHGKSEASAQIVCPPVGVAINASFFQEDHTPIGLLVVGGRELQPPLRSDSWGVFYLQQDYPHIALASERLPHGITQAFQARPRLIVQGKVLTFKVQPPTARSAVGIDAGGHLLLAVVQGGLTLAQWANCLHDALSCTDALNLDGGPSTQLAVRGKATIDIHGGWKVPVLLTIASKPR